MLIRYFLSAWLIYQSYLETGVFTAIILIGLTMSVELIGITMALNKKSLDLFNEINAMKESEANLNVSPSVRGIIVFGI